MYSGSKKGEMQSKKYSPVQNSFVILPGKHHPEVFDWASWPENYPLWLLAPPSQLSFMKDPCLQKALCPLDKSHIHTLFQDNHFSILDFHWDGLSFPEALWLEETHEEFP